MTYFCKAIAVILCQTLQMREQLNSLVRTLKLNLSWGVWFSVAAEYKAVQINEHIIDATDTPYVIGMVSDIFIEEKRHADQF